MQRDPLHFSLGARVIARSRPLVDSATLKLRKLPRPASHERLIESMIKVNVDRRFSCRCFELPEESFINKTNKTTVSYKIREIYKAVRQIFLSWLKCTIFLFLFQTKTKFLRYDFYFNNFTFLEGRMEFCAGTKFYTVVWLFEFWTLNVFII